MIPRLPESAASQRHDVIVIGGGILGACHALEATRRGLKTLLLERDDFGGATSWCSHRIVHGGLRYVQSLDFPRQLESIRERRWFLQSFPGAVRPLPCLMPLYNRGLKRLSTFRAAFLINDTLSAGRNTGLAPGQHIPGGRVLSPAEVREVFPHVERNHLRGGALWHDGMLQPPQRVMTELIRWACSGGATALNYVPAIAVAPDNEGYVVSAFDRVAGRALDFRANDVINCAGPWTGALHGPQQPGPPLSLGFSLIVDRAPIAQSAVAVSPHQAGDPMCFLVPLHGRILAGTSHLPWKPGDPTTPTPGQIQSFLNDANASVPGLDLKIDEVVRIFAGLLPAVAPGSASTSGRPLQHTHPNSRTNRRFVSVWGVKYTTARSAAEATLQNLFPKHPVTRIAPPAPVSGVDFARWSQPSAETEDALRVAIRRIQREESVVCLDDLLMRRTDWGTVPADAEAARGVVQALLDPTLPCPGDVPAHAPSLLA